MSSKKEKIIQIGKILDEKCRPCDVMKGEKDGDKKNSYCRDHCKVYPELMALGKQLSVPGGKRGWSLWTDEEIEFLEKNVEKYGVTYVAEKLDRSKSSVRDRRKKNDLKLGKVRGRRNKRL